VRRLRVRILLRLRALLAERVEELVRRGPTLLAAVTEVPTHNHHIGPAGSGLSSTCITLIKTTYSLIYI